MLYDDGTLEDGADTHWLACDDRVEPGRNHVVEGGHDRGERNQFCGSTHSKPPKVWRGKQKSADRWVGAFDVNRTCTFGPVSGVPSYQERGHEEAPAQATGAVRSPKPPANGRSRLDSCALPRDPGVRHRGLPRIRSESRPD
jgi:hypothetical protein